MRKELKSPKVENVAVAVAFEKGENDQTIYNVYLINNGLEKLEGVLVSSQGFGINHSNGEHIKTSTLRHSLKTVDPQAFSLIEPIMDQVFGLSNEYWVSFWKGDTMYDKKFIFVAESIQEQNCIDIPLLGKRGVVIT